MKVPHDATTVCRHYCNCQRGSDIQIDHEDVACENNYFWKHPCNMFYINIIWILYPQARQVELCPHQCCPIQITYPGRRTTPVSSALTEMSVRKCVASLLLTTPCMKKRKHSMSFWACPWVGGLDQSSQQLRLRSSLTKTMVSTNLLENYSAYQADQHQAQLVTDKWEYKRIIAGMCILYLVL